MAGDPTQVDWDYQIRNIPATFPPGGTASGDLSGSYPNPDVVGLQTRPVDPTAPSAGDVLTWSGSVWAPAASGGGPLPWTNFAPWLNPSAIMNDLDIRTLVGTSSALGTPHVTINANVAAPRILYAIGNNFFSVLTGIDQSIPGVADYPIILVGIYAVWNIGGGITLANQWGPYADAFGTPMVPVGSLYSNMLNIPGCLPPFTATVNLNSTNTVTVTAIPTGFTIAADMLVFGTGIPANTRVTNIVGPTLTISNAATITAAGVTIYIISAVRFGPGCVAMLVPIPNGVRGGGGPLVYGGWNVLVSRPQAG